MKFEITPEEQEKITTWLHDEVYPIIIEKQKANSTGNNPFMDMCHEDGYPYEGAIGGGLTYEFTPNSIGLTTMVKYSNGGDIFELNLTCYEDW